MGFELIFFGCPARSPVNISTMSSRILHGNFQNSNFNAAAKFMLNLRACSCDVVLPIQRFVPKKGLVDGRQTVGSDKVSLATGLLIRRISACSDVTFLTGH
jgi:hypothetical protein